MVAQITGTRKACQLFGCPFVCRATPHGNDYSLPHKRTHLPHTHTTKNASAILSTACGDRNSHPSNDLHHTNTHAEHSAHSNGKTASNPERLMFHGFGSWLHKLPEPGRLVKFLDVLYSKFMDVLYCEPGRLVKFLDVLYFFPLFAPLNVLYLVFYYLIRKVS